MLDRYFKIYGLTLSALLIGLICNGQSIFNNYYTSGSVSCSNKLLNINNSDFLVTSYFKDSAVGQQGLDLKKINATGITLVRKRYLFSNKDFGSYGNNNMQCDISNVNMIISGGSYTGTMSTVIFASVNKITLDTNWVRYYYDGIYNYRLNNTFKLKPNNIWFMGGRGNNLGYNERPTIIKMDTLGNILSIKEFTTLINYGVKCVYYDTTNKLIYIGCTDYTIPQAPQSHVVCTDTTGVIMWNQQIGAYPNSLYFSHIEKKSNYLVLCGSKWEYLFNGNNQYRMALLKLDCNNNGSTIWQKTYAKENIANGFYGFVINNDGSIVAGGDYKYPNIWTGPFDDGVIFKANSNGDSLWMHTFSNFGQGIQEMFYDIQKATDGGYILCGAPYYAQNGQSQSWVVKTDSLGIAPCITGINELTVNNEGIHIYPNPSNDKIYIEQRNGDKISLTNTLGQTVFVLNHPEPNQEIDLTLFTAGIYFLNVQTATYKKTFKILKE